MLWPAEIASTLNASFGSKLGLENQHINSGAPLFVPALSARCSGGGTVDGWYTGPGMAVRRLTPVECHRLQGFADDYLTQVKVRGKPMADGPMYKALGNSWAVPNVSWIGRRIYSMLTRGHV